MLGRITGGMATSLLFSSFECWMVAEHNRRGYSAGLLGHMFGLMFTVMYIVAIACGFISQIAADSMKLSSLSNASMIHYGGDLMPFDLSIACLLVGGWLIAVSWDENYGSGATAGRTSQGELLVSAAKWFFQERRSWFLGIVVAAFEASMFAFVFNWTPVLESKEVPPPYGLIFALFMMACACGASLSSIFGSRVQTLQQLLGAIVAACFALGVVAAKSNTPNHLKFCFGAFLVFEFAVGMYFPTIGVMKSIVVPETIRSTI
eukprot:TRINITY_DN25510_c0_g1_i1.p1 TRINITY_DN25510_c0_g1~~TRINITY_DN25510_c0_g1_i1.p1  ORF type:complete len:262 (-),score=30.59 TRINITY_DN25510_c0_g1_i1:234-1019(-)